MATTEKTGLLSSTQDAGELAKLKAYQKWAFFITFGSYFMSHFSRKCYSTVKTQLKDVSSPFSLPLPLIF